MAGKTEMKSRITHLATQIEDFNKEEKDIEGSGNAREGRKRRSPQGPPGT